jgi:hypothetical protein
MVKIRYGLPSTALVPESPESDPLPHADRANAVIAAAAVITPKLSFRTTLLLADSSACSIWQRLGC